MSIETQWVTTRHFVIVCDHIECAVKFGSDATSSVKTRKQAYAKGWRKQLYYDYDFCPIHVIFHSDLIE